jgi:hypothetical protein
VKLNVRVLWRVGVEETQGQGRGSRVRAELQYGPPSAGEHQSGGELVFTVLSWFICCRVIVSVGIHVYRVLSAVFKVCSLQFE